MTSPRELKPDQQTAAYTLDRHVSVTAGPGSGKTTVLVERYLHILREKEVSVDQIVAITFTKRAANEMRTRLRKELDRLMRTAEPLERARWLRHKRTLDGAVIETFHGFCSRLLREFPVEAEIDPQFTVLDETQSAMLIEAVVDESLTEFINSGHDAVTRLVVGVGRTSVANAAVKIYRSMRNQGLTLSAIEAAIDRNHSTEETYSRLFERADELMTEFIALENQTPGVELKRAAAATLWPQVCEMLSHIPDASTLAAYCSAIEHLRATARPQNRGKLSELVTALDEVLWSSKKDQFGKLALVCFDSHARDCAKEIVGVVRQVEQRLEEQKRVLAALDFDDLLDRVLRLFEVRPDVLTRVASRYRFFLVDEFQDTNGQQRELMQRLAISSAQRANLFVVGDGKQSIYGFRGADVDVFRAMTDDITTAGGLSLPLETNFRSQRPLIQLFNHLFARVFQVVAEKTDDELNELGYVKHEESKAARDTDRDDPIVELLIDKLDATSEHTDARKRTTHERDAKQIALRILSLVEEQSRFRYRDVALLFRALSRVSEYESVFRRFGIPYHTVQGRGFYAREEITDLLQLLKLLDNNTDEIALAAVLRSPLCGLSDDVLLALRVAPRLDKRDRKMKSNRRDGIRGLLQAVIGFEEIAFINDHERDALSRSRQLILDLIERRSRLPVADLLRFAVEQSEYLSIIAANFDGAQRLANVWKMFELAERFERSGAHMIRDFVRFVEDFERTGGRESEGQIDETADAVLLMSIHQAKGQEFPVVVIPDLTRGIKQNQRDWFMLDRTRGLTVKVPDGRGAMVGGNTLEAFRERDEWRNLYESMRLFYVAATRAMDRLILSGASAKPINTNGKSGTWLKWVVNALELPEDLTSGLVAVSEKVHVNMFVNLAAKTAPTDAKVRETEIDLVRLLIDPGSIESLFPLVKPLEPERAPYVDESGKSDDAVDKSVTLRRSLHRFSVTQLLNFQRCPRQYYFDRILQTPSLDDAVVWNSAETPEDNSTLAPADRGRIIHRFCETYKAGDDVDTSLLASYSHVVAQRSLEIENIAEETTLKDVISEVRSLADNYLASDVFKRIDKAQSSSGTSSSPLVLSEQTFVLRRPLGLLNGTIDKMIVTHVPGSEAVDVEIIDFKTDRFPKRKLSPSRSARKPPVTPSLFEHDVKPEAADILLEQVAEAAFDYELQMQAYALAVRELVPNVNELRVTIHFLSPNIQTAPAPELLEYGSCATAVDNAMMQLLSSAPDSYPTQTAEHCRFCSFREICVDGQAWIR